MVHVLSCGGNPRSATFNLITSLVLEAFGLNDKRHFPLAHSVGAHGSSAFTTSYRITQRLCGSSSISPNGSAITLIGNPFRNENGTLQLTDNTVYKLQVCFYDLLFLTRPWLTAAADDRDKRGGGRVCAEVSGSRWKKSGNAVIEAAPRKLTHLACACSTSRQHLFKQSEFSARKQKH